MLFATILIDVMKHAVPQFFDGFIWNKDANTYFLERFLLRGNNCEISASLSLLWETYNIKRQNSVGSVRVVWGWMMFLLSVSVLRELFFRVKIAIFKHLLDSTAVKIEKSEKLYELMCQSEWYDKSIWRNYKSLFLAALTLNFKVLESALEFILHSKL